MGGCWWIVLAFVGSLLLKRPPIFYIVAPPSVLKIFYVNGFYLSHLVFRDRGERVNTLILTRGKRIACQILNIPTILLPSSEKRVICLKEIQFH